MINVTDSTKTLEKVMNELNSILIVIDKYKNCYFWNLPMGFETRRSQEFTENYNYNILGDNLEIFLDLTISARNYYFTKDIYVNDKKSNIRKVKYYINKIKSILEKRGIV